MTAPAFYPIWISTRAGNSGPPIVWGAACATANEAGKVAKAKVESGEASLAFVAAIGPEGRRILPGGTHPQSARKIVEHFMAVDAMLDNPPV